MYKDVGWKLQLWAKIIFAAGVAASIILAIVLGTAAGFQALPFFMYLIGGPIIAYVSSLLIYGFGGIVMDHEPEEPDEDKSRGDSNIQWLGKK